MYFWKLPSNNSVVGFLFASCELNVITQLTENCNLTAFPFRVLFLFLRFCKIKYKIGNLCCVGVREEVFGQVCHPSNIYLRRFKIIRKVKKGQS